MSSSSGRLPSRSRISHQCPEPGVFQVRAQVPGGLRRPRGGRMGGRAQGGDPAGAVFDHDQDVHACPGRGDGLREVACRQDVGLGGREAGPCAVGAFGAGSMPVSWRASQTVETVVFAPSTSSSLCTRWYPRWGFSRTSRGTKARMGRIVGGRPRCFGRDRAVCQRRTKSRCQCSTVSGRISSGIRCSVSGDRRCGSAARNARSGAVNRTLIPLSWRSSTAIRCRGTRISVSGPPRIASADHAQPRLSPHSVASELTDKARVGPSWSRKVVLRGYGGRKRALTSVDMPWGRR